MSGVVITGPTGAIGMALIKQCIEEKRNVLAICHKGSKRIKQIPKSKYVKIIEANLDEYCSLYLEDKPEGKYDVFIHLAWNGTFGTSRDDISLQVDNIKFTLDACDLAQRIGCNIFLGAGSQAEYGRVNEPLRPDTPTFPENGYGMAKLAAGQMSRVRCEQMGIRHIWTRILSVYGPYDGENTMIMSSLRKMLNNEETHFTAGEQIWNYLYSEDAAKIILKIVEKGPNDNIICLGDSEYGKLKTYIQQMYNLSGCTARLGLGDIEYCRKQVMSCYIEEDLFEKFGLQRTSFEKGIKSIINSFLGDPYYVRI